MNPEKIAIRPIWIIKPPFYHSRDLAFRGTPFFRIGFTTEMSRLSTEKVGGLTEIAGKSEYPYPIIYQEQ
jgi:hypothetical protein